MRGRRVAGLTGAVVLAMLLAPGVGRATDGTFTKITAAGGPTDRSTPAVGAIGTGIYVFGGVHDDFRTGIDVFYNDLYRFDTGDDSWHKVHVHGLRPFPRAFAAGVADSAGGTLYVFGGATYQQNFVGFIAHADLWRYDVATNRWKLLSSILDGGPGGRSRPNMWLDAAAQKLYVFGGVDSLFRTYNDLWSFDLTANSPTAWTQLVANNPDPEQTSQPPTRHEAQSSQFPIGGKLIVYGGEHINFATGDFFTLLPDTWEYALGGGWTDRTPAIVPPEPGPRPDPPRNYGASAAIGNNLYVQGGDTPGGSQECGAPFPQNPSSDLWRFDTVSHEWTQLSPAGDPLPALKRSVATMAGGKMYIFAGFDFDCEELTSPGQVWNNDVFTYEP
jgi:N-acetylneuraminic acid mutarotase